MTQNSHQTSGFFYVILLAPPSAVSALVSILACAGSQYGTEIISNIVYRREKKHSFPDSPFRSQEIFPTSTHKTTLHAQFYTNHCQGEWDYQVCLITWIYRNYMGTSGHTNFSLLLGKTEEMAIIKMMMPAIGAKSSRNQDNLIKSMYIWKSWKCELHK